MTRLLRQCLGIFLALLGALHAPAAQSQYASDLDIFSFPVGQGSQPNVLLVIDNTANWSTMFVREMQAIAQTINALTPDYFRVGLMLFTESGGGNAGPDGGYLRAGIRTLSSDYKAQLGALVTRLDVNADQSNNGKAGMTLAEAYYYFAGLRPVTGSLKLKADYEGNRFGNTESTAIYRLPGNPMASINPDRYNPPDTSGCARNFIIYVSNGPVQDNASDTATASAALTAAYQALGRTRPDDITGLNPSGSQSNVADEWARFMRASPQAITTFTVDIDPRTSGQGPGWSALLASMAARSGGTYFRVDSGVNNGGQIAEALEQIFNQIQAVDSVFTSASLPVSVNARGTYLNQVFMGMFRPDGDAKPRWRGNLKQYRFAYDPMTGTLRLADALGQDAVSGATGFISPTARSFWTADSNFWTNQRMGTPLSASDLPDGEVVEKGGAAQRQRVAFATSQAARRVFTCVNCAANPVAAITLGDAAHQLSTANASLTPATFGLSTTAERDALIQWLRGADNAGDESGPGGTTTVRPSVHGDVLHSRPVVVNYGGTTGVVVFYGANDGLLRAVNGNATGTGAGDELWAFVPPEHLNRLQRLRSNSPEVLLSTTVVSPTSTRPPTPRDYFVDGPIGVYQKLALDGSTERVILFVGMRRGGRQVYALDVTTPTAPRYLWKRTDAELAVLGQTWSEPRVARVRGHANPVIVMGAGYDAAAEDATPPGTTTMGNAVLVLDALSGTLLRRFDTERSVPADVAVVDSDYDGYVDRAYAADAGGNVYRIDFEAQGDAGLLTGSSHWGMFRLAALGGSPVRKAFFAPDVVLGRGFTAVMVGTGDREKPLATTSNDAFFTLYDTLAAKGTPATPPAPLLPAQLGRVGSTDATARGCFIALDGTRGEKVVNAPTTVGGITYFGTNRPRQSSGTSCTADLGVTQSYAAPLFCVAPAVADVRGGGLPPSVVAGVVTVTYTDPTTGRTVDRQVDFRIGGPNEKGSSIEASRVGAPVTPTRRRGYWFLENAR